jgi:hypothetical protein
MPASGVRPTGDARGAWTLMRHATRQRADEPERDMAGFISNYPCFSASNSKFPKRTSKPPNTKVV